MPECAVPPTCSYVERDLKCQQRALPQTRPPRCAQHINAPVAQPKS